MDTINILSSRDYVSFFGYLLGSSFFVIRSILFLPDLYQQHSKIAAILFLVGSCFYILVPVNDLSQIIFHKEDRDIVDYIILILYFLGGAFYIAGSVIALMSPKREPLLAVIFYLTGNFCYLSGTVLDGMWIKKESNRVMTSLINGIQYGVIIGTIFYFLANILLTWNQEGCDTTCSNFIFNYISALYLTGSIFFFISSSLIAFRMYVIHRLTKKKQGRVNNNNNGGNIQTENNNSNNNDNRDA